MALTLRELNDGNREAVYASHLRGAVCRGSVQHALADATEFPQAKPWYRSVDAGVEPIGFVMMVRELRHSGDGAAPLPNAKKRAGQ